MQEFALVLFTSDFFATRAARCGHQHQRSLKSVNSPVPMIPGLHAHGDGVTMLLVKIHSRAASGASRAARFT